MKAAGEAGRLLGLGMGATPGVGGQVNPTGSVVWT
jgi:hypothetical protein